jgi:uncharacterized protein
MPSPDNSASTSGSTEVCGCEIVRGCEVRDTGTAKGEGVFALAPFKAGDVVIPGVIGRSVSANDSHPNQVGIDQWVIEDGLGPMVNHSCEPNCGIRLNGRAVYDYVALRAIAIGDEITWDYATRNYTISHFPPECLCATASCRGAITGWKDLTEEQKAAYAEFVAPYLWELDARRVRVTEPA